MSTARTTAKEQTPKFLTVVEAAHILGVGRTMAYALIHADEWPTPVVRFGRLIKIPAVPLYQFVATGSTPRPDAA
jgi:excisionase family DNA binding protein